MLMNRGYSDKGGNPVPSRERERESTTASTYVTYTMDPDEIVRYLTDKYGAKVVKRNGENANTAKRPIGF